MSQKQILNEKTGSDKVVKKEKESEKDEKVKEIKINIIIGIINAVKNDLRLKIINSYENAKTESNYLRGKENEEEIKVCVMYINEKK